MGPGETVRLDHVMIAKKDPHVDPEHWLALEFVAFIALDRPATVATTPSSISRLLCRLQRNLAAVHLQRATASTRTATLPWDASATRTGSGGVQARVPRVRQRRVLRPGPVGPTQTATRRLCANATRAGRGPSATSSPRVITPDQMFHGRGWPTFVRVRSQVRRRVLPARLPPCDSGVSSWRVRHYLGNISRAMTTCACDDPTQRTASCASWCARSPAAVKRAWRARAREGGPTRTPRCSSARG